MATKSSLSKLEIKLINAGKMLLHLPSSNDEIICVLKQTEEILSRVQQTPSTSINNAMQSITKTLIAKELLKHPDMNVNISVASCICEVMRIMAPESPYEKQEMTDFFEMVVITFEKLSSANDGCYTKMTKVLKVFSHNRLSILMLDFELDGHGLIFRLFKQFLTVAGFNSSVIVHKMEIIMTMIIEESKELAPKLTGFLVSSVKNDNQIASAVCLQLVEKVLMNHAAKLIPHLPVMRRDMSIALYDYAKMVGRICETSTENDIKDLKMTNKISRLREDSNRKIKVECLETVRHGQHEVHSEDRIKHEKTFDDSLMLSKSVTDLNGKRKRNDTPSKTKAQSVKYEEKLVGSRIKVWWADDEMYYEGVVKSFDCLQRRHKVLYEDGQEEFLDLKLEEWELVQTLSAGSDYGLEHGENLVGKRIKVWWPLYKTYYDGVVESFDFTEKKHKISYDDGDEELICLKGRLWELIENVSAMSDSPRELVLALPRKDSSQCAINFRQRNIAAECVYETSSPRELVLALPRKDSSQCAINFCQRNIAAECVYETSSPRELVLALPRKDSSQCAINFRQRNFAAECVYETSSPRKPVSSESDIISVQGYKVKKSNEQILNSIFKKHGDIAAKCVLKTADARSSFLEVICEIVRRIQTNNVDDKMEEIECQVSDAETANIEVSWLRAHLEVIHKREAMKKSTFPTQMNTNGCLTRVVNGGKVVKST